ncbi:hypothetical protein [Massilia sp. CCM 8734]|uniref:hypothetical protein n=1 Tax=Massilia sp. CCM 8734 TaxID=2609283 RepID=UPI00142139A7|nr:hypothetical protein [Massilia sp. CCM 8734]NIA00429.1 hypothetical protein [Massilia sp. CCM 8734]
MKTLIIEHVALTELPAAWQAHLPLAPNTRVTVRIEEEESEDQQGASPLTANPLFGMWKDREDIADVAAHARQLRAARFDLDASRGKG